VEESYFVLQNHLFSDHRPLAVLTKATSGNNSKLIRWSLALQEFDWILTTLLENPM